MQSRVSESLPIHNKAVALKRCSTISGATIARVVSTARPAAMVVGRHSLNLREIRILDSRRVECYSGGMLAKIWSNITPFLMLMALAMK